MTSLIEPNKRYRRSYQLAQREIGIRRRTRALASRRNFVRQPHAARLYWIVDGGEYIGYVQIRTVPSSSIDPRLKNHIYYEVRPTMRRMGYGTEALRLALRKAREFGLKSVYLVCRKSHTGSRKIIEKNGGILLLTLRMPDSRYVYLKFKIRIV